MIFLFCFVLLGGHLTWSNKRKERWFVEKGRENNKWKKEGEEVVKQTSVVGTKTTFSSPSF